ncbi:MAG: amino acid permease [Acidobacteriota bacterium]|nr:MAG: amino acid permease [Acidobacteriota bacterium]
MRSLVRGLGVSDAILITIGSVLGSGVFITTGDIARSLPHPGLILLVWIAGGTLTLAGALTYAELGGMFPRAGGQYHFLKEAYGPFWGFLFGWAAFLVIMTGGIATLAVGFGEYLGYFLPFFSTGHVLFSLSLGPTMWAPTGGQLAGGLAIVFLSAVNYVGLKEGTRLQNVVTLAKVASLLGLAGIGFLMPARVDTSLLSTLPESVSGGLLAAFGVGMVAALWSYDGWYAVTNMAGEMRKPSKDLPLGIIAGTLTITFLYAVTNLVYVRTLSVPEMAATGRIGETAATTLFGDMGGRVLTAAVLVSIFGCISSTILYAARVYLPMAEDGSFFPIMARIHPKYRTPSACLVAQGLWAIVLTFSGSYEQLYTYVVFALVVFHTLTGLAVFVLRRARPEAPRPYRTWGYPFVPAVFILSSAALVVNTLSERPAESLIGSGLLLAGVPVYLYWRSRSDARIEN